MNLSLKATLLSALVFPGAGHILLKRYILAAVFSVISIACLGVILFKFVELSKIFARKISHSSAVIGEIDLFELFLKSWMEIDANTIHYAFWICFVVWLIALLDAFRVGYEMDKTAVRQKTEM